MIKITVTAGTFGAGDTPPCERCGEPMNMAGRETHPELGERYELQTFECGGCNHISTRNVDEQGQTPTA